MSNVKLSFNAQLVEKLTEVAYFSACTIFVVETFINVFLRWVHIKINLIYFYLINY